MAKEKRKFKLTERQWKIPLILVFAVFVSCFLREGWVFVMAIGFSFMNSKQIAKSIEKILWKKT